MATRYDAMCIGFPEWIHIGMECGDDIIFDDVNDAKDFINSVV